MSLLARGAWIESLKLLLTAISSNWLNLAVQKFSLFLPVNATLFVFFSKKVSLTAIYRGFFCKICLNLQAFNCPERDVGKRIVGYVR